MKILRIIARLNVGGPARHVVWLTEALNDGEFETLLIAGTVPQGEEDMAYFADEHGVTPVFLKEMSRELSFKDAVSVLKILRQLLTYQPDIVHTHTAKAGTVGRIATFIYRWLTPAIFLGRPRNVKVVHTFHGHVFHSYYGRLKTSLFVNIERTLARFATHRIITISEQQRLEINEEFRVGRAEQFSVIPLGIDVNVPKDIAEKRTEFRSRFGIPNNTFLFGFVGRLTEIKDLPTFLEAISIYERCHIMAGNVRFVIVGDGHLRGQLEKRSDELKISNIVTFTGNLADIASAYCGLDAVVLTSLNEGTPLSVIEGMSFGKPIVSTEVGGVVDLLGTKRELTDGYSVCERGVSVAPGDPAALSNAINRLVCDEGLRTKTAEAGRQFVKKNYSKDRLVSDIKELYRHLMTETP
ncbi:glycosyltransferase [Leptolyngbya sp. 7M]|uniref:glycosyltransferase n=1 Tax=Leptolyngbya sp. 7M TaxID=2812896 RepID=UPI001B8CFA1D|nr:glycosyltransferase [Leptolyngbya sp. 7M]QYO66716.1 glycosyltransferase [Leptolyngbya sp. 7M]